MNVADQSWRTGANGRFSGFVRAGSYPIEVFHAALAVLQAGLHEVPEGFTLIHGYRLATAGLGAWVGDRRVRVSIWPALIDAAGEIDADDPDEPDADVLVIDIDPLEFGAELEELVRLGRLIVAGPESGPVPLVVDLDRDLLQEVVTAATTA